MLKWWRSKDVFAVIELGTKGEKLRYTCYTDLKIKPKGTVLVLNSKETNTEALAYVFRPVINTPSSMSQFSCESNFGNVVIIIVSLRRRPSYHR